MFLDINYEIQLILFGCIYLKISRNMKRQTTKDLNLFRFKTKVTITPYTNNLILLKNQHKDNVKNELKCHISSLPAHNFLSEVLCQCQCHYTWLLTKVENCTTTQLYSMLCTTLNKFTRHSSSHHHPGAQRRPLPLATRIINAEAKIDDSVLGH